MTSERTILVVDDSRVSRLLARQFILDQHPGWNVVEASTGEEALEKVAACAPALIIVDVNMPGMGGLAAAEQLRAACPAAHITLLTANVQAATRNRAQEMGIGFMEKPITAPRVNAMLAVLG